MSDARDVLLERLAGRGGPTHPDLRPAWRRLAPGDRDRLRWTATDPTAAAHLDDDLSRVLVDALAADRARRRRWDILVPTLTALLVVATVWGFGRAVFATSADWFLLLGILGGAATCVTGWRRRARARASARAVRRVLRR